MSQLIILIIIEIIIFLFYSILKFSEYIFFFIRDGRIDSNESNKDISAYQDDHKKPTAYKTKKTDEESEERSLRVAIFKDVDDEGHDIIVDNIMLDNILIHTERRYNARTNSIDQRIFTLDVSKHSAKPIWSNSTLPLD